MVPQANRYRAQVLLRWLSTSTVHCATGSCEALQFTALCRLAISSHNGLFCLPHAQGPHKAAHNETRVWSVPWTVAALPTSNPTLFGYMFSAVSFHVLYMPSDAGTFIYSCSYSWVQHHGPRVTEAGALCISRGRSATRCQVALQNVTLSAAKDVLVQDRVHYLAARRKHMLALLLFCAVASLLRQTLLLVACLCLGRRFVSRLAPVQLGAFAELKLAGTRQVHPVHTMYHRRRRTYRQYLHAIISTTPANHHRKADRQLTRKQKGREKPSTSFPRSAATLL
ncbi:hypothetical protein HDV63DRAFT_216444 [Trichoderma sp. SZMC 28014]